MKMLIIFLLGILSLSCQGNHETDKGSNIGLIPKIDTLVGSQNITGKKAGSNLIKRSTVYFLIVEHDTSEFKPVFSERKDGKVVLTFNFRENKTTTHQQRMKELTYILPKAALNYNFGAFKLIVTARLIYTGDLAVFVTNQYLAKFGNKKGPISREQNQTISKFLLQSRLTTDFNKVLAPYGISVQNIDIEHPFFIPKKFLYLHSLVQTDSTKVPGMILDCITWLTLKK